MFYPVVVHIFIMWLALAIHVREAHVFGNNYHLCAITLMVVIVSNMIQNKLMENPTWKS